MDPRFAEVVDRLHPSFESLMAQAPNRPLQLPEHVPAAGIYLLSEGSSHLYVGRSNHIRRRLGNHCRLGASHRMAAFAFRLAREATGNLKATYKFEGSRNQLILDPEFASAFQQAKERIRAMDVRIVAAPEPINQAILEIYVSVTLQTPYNDFDTH